MFVADASVTLAWYFRDEASAFTDDLLKQLRFEGEALVPAHWSTEVLNGLLVAARRNRIAPEQSVLIWDKIHSLYITVEPPVTPVQAKAVLALSNKHALTVYDAAYLELALRKAVPVATLDKALHRAALLEDMAMLQRW